MTYLRTGRPLAEELLNERAARARHLTEALGQGCPIYLRFFNSEVVHVYIGVGYYESGPCARGAAECWVGDDAYPVLRELEARGPQGEEQYNAKFPEWWDESALSARLAAALSGTDYRLGSRPEIDSRD
jgi:hypothetical protein